MNKMYIEERAINLAHYIIDSKDTVRGAAKRFGISKSTVHKDLTERLPQIDHHLAEEVRASVQFGLSRNEGFAYDDIFLVGPGAAGRFCAVLSDVFPERSVKTVFPERRFGLDFPSCEGWTAALGLALREYDGQA